MRCTSAKKVRYEPSEEDELRDVAVRMHYAHERAPASSRARRLRTGSSLCLPEMVSHLGRSSACRKEVGVDADRERHPDPSDVRPGGAHRRRQFTDLNTVAPFDDASPEERRESVAVDD